MQLPVGTYGAAPLNKLFASALRWFLLPVQITLDSEQASNGVMYMFSAVFNCSTALPVLMMLLYRKS